MKTNCPTINQVIAMLEKAKAEHGGEMRVRIHDMCGDHINPTGMDSGSTMRGNQYFEWIAFEEKP